MKNIYAILISAFLIFSCNKGYKDNDSNFHTIHSPVFDCKVLAYSEVFDYVHFIKLETNTNCLIGNIDAILYHKNVFYIFDKLISKSVFIFNDEGKYLGRVGNLGNGPGEYISPEFITLNLYTDEILIYDNTKKIILFYDLMGNYINSIKLKNRINAFSVLEKDLFVVYYNYFGKEHIDELPTYNLQIINSNGKVILEAFDRTQSNIPNTTSINNFFHFNDELLFHPSFDSRIYTISNNDISTKYKLDMGENLLSTELLQNFVVESDDKQQVYDKIYNSDKTYIHGFCELRDFLIFNIRYKGKLHNIFYSKRTKNIKYSTAFINNVYGVITGSNIFYAMDSTKLVSYFIPSANSVEYYKYLMKNALNDQQFLKNQFLKSIQQAPQNACNDSAKKIILSTKFEVTENEYQFINDVDQNQNPILIIHKLKD